MPQEGSAFAEGQPERELKKQRNTSNNLHLNKSDIFSLQLDLTFKGCVNPSGSWPQQGYSITRYVHPPM